MVWARGGLGIDAQRGGAAHPADYSNTLELGRALYTRYAYPLELAAMVLLVAMIGAIVLTLRQRVGTRRQVIAEQLARQRAETVAVVKVPVGAGVGAGVDAEAAE